MLFLIDMVRLFGHVLKVGHKIPGITIFMHENLFVFDVSEIDYLDQFYNEQYIF